MFDNDPITHQLLRELIAEVRALRLGQRQEIRVERKELGVLRGIQRSLQPRLSCAKIQFLRSTGMPTQGPITLSHGQSTVASVAYFDQTGAPMPSDFVPPPVTFTIDNAGVASSTPNSDGQTDAIAYVSAGVANLTINLTSAEGLAITDTETVTCSPVVLPPPVLTSAKIVFSDPTP